MKFILQNYLLWDNHEELRGMQHLQQVSYHDKVCHEDDEQLLGNDYIYVFGC